MLEQFPADKVFEIDKFLSYLLVPVQTVLSPQLIYGNFFLNFFNPFFMVV